MQSSTGVRTAEYTNGRGIDYLLNRGRKGRKGFQLGNQGSNSNGHEKDMDKEGHMMKLIEIL